jgi:hypothetical protein
MLNRAVPRRPPWVGRCLDSATVRGGRRCFKECGCVGVERRNGAWELALVQVRLSDELLSALRERRHRQSLERARRRPFGFLQNLLPWRRRTTKPPTLEAVVQPLFSTANPDVKRAANQYVRGMEDIQSEVENEHDAFLLDPGMGPMLFLTAAGRILVDGRNWDGEVLREATEDEAISALVVGAQKTGIGGLLELIPSRPTDGSTCPMCFGSRRAEPVPGASLPKMICLLCRGRGWVVQSMLDEAASKGTWPPRTS